VLVEANADDTAIGGNKRIIPDDIAEEISKMPNFTNEERK
jgi:hypothetical protein